METLFRGLSNWIIARLFQIPILDMYALGGESDFLTRIISRWYYHNGIFLFRKGTVVAQKMNSREEPVYLGYGPSREDLEVIGYEPSLSPHGSSDLYLLFNRATGAIEKHFKWNVEHQFDVVPVQPKRIGHHPILLN